MKTDNVELRESPIHGTGVFATKEFRAGETVLLWDTSGTQWKTLEEFEADKPSLGADARFAAYLKGREGRKDLCLMLQAPERHVNYACSSNTVASWTDQGPAYVALRDIVMGEEVTADYSEEIPFEGECAGCQGCRGEENKTQSS